MIRFFAAVPLAALALTALGVTPAHADTTLIEAGAEWFYLDDGSNQGTAWQTLTFADCTAAQNGGWSCGNAQLGYGDNDEATVVSFGGNSSNKFITTYFLHTFSVADPGAFTGLELRLLRDDGAVVYLNGNEIRRDNLPGGTISFSTIASSTVGGSDEDLFFSSLHPITDLQPGVNVIAVEIHQRSGTSSDISFDMILSGTDDLPDVVRGPYLQNATPTTVNVRWRTNVVTDGRVWYGTDPMNLNLQTDSTVTWLEHDVELTGLAPDTTYYYAVGDFTDQLAGGDLTHTFTMPPVIGTRKPTRIWAIGDSGTANSNAAAVRNAYLNYTGTTPTDVWLMLGDNAYSDGTDPEYQAAVFDMYPTILRNTFLWSTLGNHDGHSTNASNQTGPYYSIFTLPRGGTGAGSCPSGTEAYYSFDYANIHFVCLESYQTDRSVGGCMMTWLEADLAQATADWIIAFWHHPPYTKGSHDSDTEGQLIDMRQNAVPILEDAGVDLVLTGHSHAYERTFLIDGHYGNSNSFAAGTHAVNSGSGREDTPDGAYQKATLGIAPHEGAVYIVAGSSGQATGGSLDHEAMYISLNQLGSVAIDVDANRMDVKFIRSNNTITDYFTIVKPPVPNCPCDWNADTNLNSDDFFAFLDDFFAGIADFDDNGTTNSDDFFSFLDCFFSPPGGC